MNLTFVSTGQYPDSHAAAIRHSTLAKGLIALGHQINFLVLSPQQWVSEHINYEGCNFQTLNSYKGSNKILKNLLDLKAIFKARKIIKEQIAQKQLDALVIFTIEPLPIYFLQRLAHGSGIKVFHERTELPYALTNASKKQQILLKFYLNKLLPKFDGIFCISDKLVNYIRQFNPHTHKLLTVVDLAFFTTQKTSPYQFPYIGYCGTISGNKDGVPILIEAFASITQKFPLIKLVLVGNNNNQAAIKETLDTIEKYQLSNKVIFTGLVDRDMMPVILCNAEILVVSKPDNEQNSGNFPIKIGEYLATGVPVVVTRVGEIPLFIKDGHSGFLAEPGNADSFAQKMEEALSNSAKAKSAGEEGKQIAINQFDYKIQAGIMADYINKIKNTA